ncbi:hypothetical protein [Telluria aromaticivorans]|uniref:hypothetical protein n=1 Tax=Telluria aromaticivorans TaxID=2725995 RepID=UPI001E6051C3|nr:hypothetical protein [Telluria aromaticivorans]
MASPPTRSAGTAATASAGPAPEDTGTPMTQDDGAPAAAATVTDAIADAAPAAGTGSGLATPDQIVELADQLSACADQIHERVMREIRAYAGGPVPDKVQATARALLEDEVLLRQRANGLYADAATFIVRALGKPQAQLVKLTTDAAEKIRRIGVIGEVTSLVGGLLALAGAAATGQAVPVLVALEKIHKQVKAIEALAPKPPAKAS